MISIDLNADLGEHAETDIDEQIMPWISSCNIACGGHVGHEGSVRETVRLAKAQGVAVGAHPSYPDKLNFGRKVMQMQPGELAASISSQISLVQRICDEEEVKLHHIKPHGALYNQAAADAFVSKLVLNVIKEKFAGVPWMGLARSISEEVAISDNYPFIAEGFADRQYEANGTLRSRDLQGAVLPADQVKQQAEELVLSQRVHSSGGWITMKVQSICLHGDTDGAVTLAKQINKHLVSRGVQITAI